MSLQWYNDCYGGRQLYDPNHYDLVPCSNGRGYMTSLKGFGGGSGSDDGDTQTHNYYFNLPEQPYSKRVTSMACSGGSEKKYNFYEVKLVYNENMNCYDFKYMDYYGREIGNYLLSKFPNSSYKFIIYSVTRNDNIDNFHYRLQLLIEGNKYCVEFNFIKFISDDYKYTGYQNFRSSPFANTIASDIDFGGNLYFGTVSSLYSFENLINSASNAYQEHLEYERKKNWCLPFCCE